MVADDSYGGGRHAPQPHEPDLDTRILEEIRKHHHEAQFAIKPDSLFLSSPRDIVKLGWLGSSYWLLGARKVLHLDAGPRTVDRPHPNFTEYTVLDVRYVSPSVIDMLVSAHVRATQESLNNTTFGR